MRTSSFGVILENAARLAGRQVGLVGVPENWKALAALAIGDGLRRIAAEKLPAMRRVEFRRYRPTWTTNTGWTPGQECWYDGHYWQLYSDSPSGAPDADGSGWRMMKMTEVSAFIEFEQPWEPTAIDSGSVDVNRFAFVADPRQNPNAAPLKVVGMSDLGVLLQAPAPEGVYVQFTPRMPNITFAEWSDELAYQAGDVVYHSNTKDCYQAVADVAADEAAPSSNDKWFPLRVPDVFAPYLTRLAASDLLTEDQGKFQTRAAADREFDDLCERYHEGSGETRVRTGRFM